MVAVAAVPKVVLRTPFTYQSYLSPFVALVAVNTVVPPSGQYCLIPSKAGKATSSTLDIATYDSLSPQYEFFDFTSIEKIPL